MANSFIVAVIGGELSKVKGLALGTLFGVARDMIAQWVPETLKKDVTEIVNNFTSNLGGKVIQEPILGQGDSSTHEGSSGAGDAQPLPEGIRGAMPKPVDLGALRAFLETATRRG